MPTSAVARARGSQGAKGRARGHGEQGREGKDENVSSIVPRVRVARPEQRQRVERDERSGRERERARDVGERLAADRADGEGRDGGREHSVEGKQQERFWLPRSTGTRNGAATSSATGTSVGSRASTKARSEQDRRAGGERRDAEGRVDEQPQVAARDERVGEAGFAGAEQADSASTQSRPRGTSKSTAPSAPTTAASSAKAAVIHRVRGRRVRAGIITRRMVA